MYTITNFGVLLCFIVGNSQTQKLINQFHRERSPEYYSSSEEAYNFHPQLGGFHPLDEYHYRRPSFQDVGALFGNGQRGPYFYPQMPIIQPYPEVVPVPSSEDSGMDPDIEPDVKHGMFDNPLKKVMDPMRKQMSETMKDMSESMGKQAEEVGKQFETAGQQMVDMAQKPAEEFSKQVEGAMKDAQEQFEEQIDGIKDSAEDLENSVPDPSEFDPEGMKRMGSSKSNSTDIKDKLGDQANKTAEMDKIKKQMPENPMQQTGDKLKKTFPVPMPASLMGRIYDETSEVQYEDERYFPRAEAMEWNRPELVNIDTYQEHPRGRFYDYYYDGQ